MCTGVGAGCGRKDVNGEVERRRGPGGQEGGRDLEEDGEFGIVRQRARRSLAWSI